ncbi:MAG: hypothetical protein JKY27_05950 [Magnetovibrio sp.]|nr:hypothetical protein [Magnetovibrio sp.]
MQELFITNGDVVGDSLRQAYPEVVVLPWQDVLHEGPVPMTADPIELSYVRARYLNAKWGVHAGTDFGAREGMFGDISDFERIGLWFEHDLYDQLQLLQVLDRLSVDRPTKELFLVQADDYLGLYGPDKIGAWLDRAEQVTPAQFDTAEVAWHAFRQDSPEAWFSLLDKDLSALPYLATAVLRMLEELPSEQDGLSRTERHILEMVDKGHIQPNKMFKAYQDCEEAQFMGDWSFFDRLNSLATVDEPLLRTDTDVTFTPGLGGEALQTYLGTRYQLTNFGQAVLAGDQDHAQSNIIDFWWGGTYVTNENLWRWDGVEQALKSQVQ